jgi:tape measure domain-containing protein
MSLFGTDTTVTAILTARDQGFAEGMKKAAMGTQSLMDKVGGAGRSIGRLIGSGALLQIGMRSVDAGIRAITSHTGDAIKRFDTMNNFPKVMANLGVGSKAAEQSIKDLSKGIEGLPTTLDSAALGVQRFTSANGDIRKSTKYFLAMNNAIVAGAAPVEMQSSAIEQLSQAYAKGKMDMQEWRTIQAAMPGQLKQVASAMGMTSAELGEGLRDGSISMDKFMDKMVELNEEGTGNFKSFADQARNATDGIGTAMANLHTAITRGIADAMFAVDKALKNNKLPTIGQMINSVGDKIGKFGKKVAGVISKIDLAGIVKSATPYWNLFKSALEKAGAVLKKVGGFLLDHADTITKVLPWVVALGAAFKAYGIITTFVPALMSMSKIFGKLAGGVLAKLAPQLYATAAGETAAGTGAKGAAKPMMQMGVAVLMIGAGIVLAAAGIWIMVDAAKNLAAAGWPAVGALVGLVAVLVGIAAAAAIFAAPLVAAGIALVAFGAGLLVVGIAVLVFAAALALARNAIVAILDAVAKAFNSVVDTITSAVLRLAPVVIGVMMAIESIITSVGDSISKILDSIAGIFDSIGIAAINAGIGFNLVARGIRSLVKLPLADISATLIVVAGGLKKVSKAGEGLSAAGKGMQIIARETRQISSGGSRAAAAITGIKSAAVGANMGMRAAAAGIKSSMNQVTSAAQSMMNRTKAIMSRTGWARACGAQISRGFARGIRSSLGEARSAANALAAVAEKAVRKKSKIRSPSRVFIALGKLVGSGFAVGIESMARSVKHTMESLVSIPDVYTPSFAMDTGGFSMGDGYIYGGDNKFEITVISEIDGREAARAIAPYSEEESNKRSLRERRKRGGS